MDGALGSLTVVLGAGIRAFGTLAFDAVGGGVTGTGVRPVVGVPARVLSGGVPMTFGATGTGAGPVDVAGPLSFTVDPPGVRDAVGVAVLVDGGLTRVEAVVASGVAESTGVPDGAGVLPLAGDDASRRESALDGLPPFSVVPAADDFVVGAVFGESGELLAPVEVAVADDAAPGRRVGPVLPPPPLGPAGFAGGVNPPPPPLPPVPPPPSAGAPLSSPPFDDVPPPE